jgi:hypothetical protein
VLGQVGQRFGDDEVGVGLDLAPESACGHVDMDGQPQSLDELLDACS